MIKEGISSLAFRDSPHFVLVIEEFYFDRLETPLREWLCEYFLEHVAFQQMGATREERHQLLLAALGPSAPAPGCDRLRQLLVFAREWLIHTLPFILAKVNRVHYGLLRHKVPETWVFDFWA